MLSRPKSRANFLPTSPLSAEVQNSAEFPELKKSVENTEKSEGNSSDFDFDLRIIKFGRIFRTEKVGRKYGKVGRKFVRLRNSSDFVRLRVSPAKSDPAPVKYFLSEIGLRSPGWSCQSQTILVFQLLTWTNTLNATKRTWRTAPTEGHGRVLPASTSCPKRSSTRTP